MSGLLFAPYAVTKDATLPEIATMMVSGHLHCVLVTREADVTGIIGTLDLVPLLSGLESP